MDISEGSAIVNEQIAPGSKELLDGIWETAGSATNLPPGIQPPFGLHLPTALHVSMIAHQNMHENRALDRMGFLTQECGEKCLRSTIDAV
jgi:hypothetical protein